jgi:hypothetical protein
MVLCTLNEKCVIVYLIVLVINNIILRLFTLTISLLLTDMNRVQ